MAYKDKARKTAYQNEFIKQSYDRINLTVPKGQKEKIQSVAAEQGESVNEYIKKAIAQRMERDTAGTDTAGGGYGISEGVQQGNSMKSVHLSSTDTSSTGQKQESAFDVMKRLAAMSKEERERAMGVDPESMEQYHKKVEKEKKRLEELEKKRQIGGLFGREDAEYWHLVKMYGRENLDKPSSSDSNTGQVQE